MARTMLAQVVDGDTATHWGANKPRSKAQQSRAVYSVGFYSFMQVHRPVSYYLCSLRLTGKNEPWFKEIKDEVSYSNY